MATVFDVANYILSETGSMTTWKLQKLVYYSQAWHAVWEDQQLFQESIEAWANGPVCPDLYSQHRGMFKVGSFGKGKFTLKKSEKESIDVVLKHYGKKSAEYLSELTHQEAPWKDARKGLPAGVRGNRKIPVDAMAEYYGGLKATP